MEFKVYKESFNEKKIVEYNIFNHSGFLKDLKNIKKAYNKKLKEFIAKQNSDSAGFFNDMEMKNFKSKYKEIFKQELNKALKYNFWGRCEYEIILTSWPPAITKEESKRVFDEFQKRDHVRETVNLSVDTKIDIYSQVHINFDLFADYVWNNLDNI